MEQNPNIPNQTEFFSENKAEANSRAEAFLETAKDDFTGAVKAGIEDGSLFQLFPELNVMARIDQRPDYHSEGDVLTHTLLALDHISRDASLELKFATLFHDVGKIGTDPFSIVESGRDTSALEDKTRFHGHNKLGATYIQNLLSPLGQAINTDRVSRLVADHMVCRTTQPDLIKDSTIEKYFLADPAYGEELKSLTIADIKASLREGDIEGRIGDTYIQNLKDRIAEVRSLRLLQSKRLEEMCEEGLIKEGETLESVAANIVYIQDTPNFMTAFSAYANKRAGLIRPTCRYYPKFSGVVDHGPKEAMGKCLFSKKELSPENLQELVKGNRYLRAMSIYSRVLNVDEGNRLSWLSRQEKEGYSPLFFQMIQTARLVHLDEPVEFIEKMGMIIDAIKKFHIDVRRLKEGDLDQLREQFPEYFVPIEGLLDQQGREETQEHLEIINIPKYERGGVIDYSNVAEFELNIARAELLRDEHLIIVVGGRPNVGKSTFSVSLEKSVARELERINALLGVSLNSRVVDMDEATPVSTQIGRGAPPEEVRKHSWDRALAARAAQKLRKTSDEANITIADVPGGNPDNITRALVGSADAAIILGRENWEDEMRTWGDFFKQIGVQVLGKIRSRMPEEVHGGDLRTYQRGQFVSGRVVGLSREIIENDKLIDNVAKILIVDLLPTMIQKREGARTKILEGVKRDFNVG